MYEGLNNEKRFLRAAKQAPEKKAVGTTAECSGAFKVYFNAHICLDCGQVCQGVGVIPLVSVGFCGVRSVSISAVAAVIDNAVVLLAADAVDDALLVGGTYFCQPISGCHVLWNAVSAAMAVMTGERKRRS